MSERTHPGELAERALAAATGPCVVLVGAHQQANLRWAANTLTTNGITSGQDVTVIAVHDGTRVGAITPQRGRGGRRRRARGGRRGRRPLRFAVGGRRRARAGLGVRRLRRTGEPR